MIMLKQSPSRNQRSKGFKIKHVLQIVVLLAFGIWLLNQLQRSYYKTHAHQETAGRTSENLQSEHEAIKLGRKGLHPRVEDSSSLEPENRAETDGDIEDVQPEDMEEDEGRGGGDDEIDGLDQEKAEVEELEEVEDLVDIEDEEREEGSEEQENEGEDSHLEDGRSGDVQSQRREAYF